MQNTQSSDRPENNRLLKLRQWSYLRKVLLGEVLGNLGRALPRSVKTRLAKRSSRLGYLLLKEGDFILSDYCGSLSVHINVRNNIEREMLTGSYESDLLQTIKNYVNPGDYCMDIGANVGAVSLPLCQLVGSRGKVVCFEPGPSFFERLAGNLKLNAGLSEIAELHCLGLSNEKGSMYWAEDTQFPGNAWLLGEGGVSVPVTTVDGFVAHQRPDKIDFVKIDVEGMELEVLLGARRSLRKYQPVLLFESSLEFEAIRGRPVRKLVQELLIEMGYRLYAVGSRGKLTPSSYPFLGANTLALPGKRKGKRS